MDRRQGGETGTRDHPEARAGSDASARLEALRLVANPLPCFTLALLAIEALIALVVVFSKMGATQQFYGVMVMAGLVVAMVVAGVWMSTSRPRAAGSDANQVLREARAALDRMAELEAIMNSRDFPVMLDNRPRHAGSEQQRQLTPPGARDG